MTNQEKISLETSKEKEQNLLPEEIRNGLNEIRKQELSFHEKAKQLALLLEHTECREIKILDCDVCIIDFFPEFYQKLSEIYPRNFDNLSHDQQEEIHQKMFKLIPEEANVRVHAQTPVGYFTYCFGCEATMCGNEVEYSEDSDWDSLHKKKVKEILAQHPEWQVESFQLSGSTRNRICIDVISQDSGFKFHQFDIDNIHFSINPISEEIIKNIPQIKDNFDQI
jgi:hypothetical protein